MTFRVEWLSPQLLAIALSIAMAALAWKRPNVGRGLFAVLFLWAAIVNAETAVARPAEYLGLATLTESPTYRAILEGPFARHITTYVLLVALGQLCIGVGLLLRSTATRIACAAALVFLVAVAPLGIGSAFPSTLILAGGAAVLLRRRFEHSLFAEIRRGIGERRPGRSTA